MNETTIRKWWQIFKGNGTLTEVRIINPKKAEPIAVTLKILILSLRLFGLMSKAISISH